MKRGLGILIGLLAAGLVSCVPLASDGRSTLNLLTDRYTYSSLPLRTEWERWGAYYELDELFIQTPQYSYGQTKYFISKRLRILTKEGTVFGSVPVPHYRGTISTFTAHLWDEKGIEKPLDIYGLRAEYKKSGLIVFPNVTPGCVCEVFLVIESQRPVVAFEYWFTRAIPVWKSKFTFSHPARLTYAFKPYGRLPPAEAVATPGNSSMLRHVWSRENVLPRSSLLFQGSFDKTEDRIAMAMRYGMDHPVFSDWSEIARSLNLRVFGKSYPELDRQTNKLAPTITAGGGDALKKADQIICWTQENISPIEKFDDDDDFDPAGALAVKKGSLWERAIICKNLLAEIGLDADIILTRGRSYGGFDSSFINPYALVVPVLSISINNRTYAGFPYGHGGALGEYPQDYLGLQGLSLDRQRIAGLPEPPATGSQIQYSYSVAFSDDSLKNELDLSYAGYSAYALRSALLSRQNSDNREFFQKMLTAIDPSNKLEKCMIYHLNDRGKPMRVQLAFSNQNAIFDKKGKRHISLAYLFPDYFNSIDSARLSPFDYEKEVTIRESVSFVKPAGKAVSIALSCEPSRNDLFMSFCTTGETPESFTMTRTIQVNRTRIPAEKLAPVFENVKTLNSIKDSYLMIE